MLDLFTAAWMDGAEGRYCIQGLAANCRFSPCLEANEISCCGDCEFVRNCSAPCEAFRRKE